MSVSVTFSLVLNTGISANRFQGVANIGNGRLLAVGLNGTLYRSPDNGVSWTNIGSLPPQGAFPGSTFTSRVFSPATDVAFVYEAGRNVGLTEDGYLRRTLDGGDSWATVWTHPTTPTFSSGTWLVTFLKMSATEYWAFGVLGNRSGLDQEANYIKTTDSGSSWSAPPYLSIDAVNADLEYEAVIQLESGRILAGRMLEGSATDFGQDAHVRYSDDLGTTWPMSAAFENFYQENGARYCPALCEIAPNIVLASIGPTYELVLLKRSVNLWRSTDGGLTWPRVPTASIAGYPTTNNSVTPGPIFKLAHNVAIFGWGYEDDATAFSPGWRLTEDGGLTWTKVTISYDAPPDGLFYTPSQMVLADDGALIIAENWDTGAGNVARIWRGVPVGLPLNLTPLPWPDTLAARGAQPTATKFTALYSSGGGVVPASPSVVGGFHL